MPPPTNVAAQCQCINDVVGGACGELHEAGQTLEAVVGVGLEVDCNLRGTCQGSCHGRQPGGGGYQLQRGGVQCL